MLEISEKNLIIENLKENLNSKNFKIDEIKK
jgi:hypothetical protein